MAHDPKQSPLAEHVKFTENTNRMAPGDGLWQTIRVLGTYTLYAEDPRLGNVAYYGTGKENGATALFGVRLKERAGRVTEAESFVVRQATGVHGSFENLTTRRRVGRRPRRGERSTRSNFAHRCQPVLQRHRAGQRQDRAVRR